MEQLYCKPIGEVKNNDAGACIQLDQEYVEGLTGLEGFSHLTVVWWFSEFDNEEMRSVLKTPKPYKKAPEELGIFATRSPVRPNPVAITVVEVLHIDVENGVIIIPYIDAYDKTPVIDIKPYTPSVDRIEEPKVPQWCAHWPGSVEESADFPWEEEFLFTE